jgi:glycosyltransferase 2 family protein
MASGNLLKRYRKWLVWALVAGVLVYGGLAMWSDSQKVSAEMKSLNWRLLIPVVLLTLANYLLRCVKWIYLLRRLEIKISIFNASRIFFAGLSMTISPAKAGELLKPYLVSKHTGVSMATTTSALVAERLTDIIAILSLMALGLGGISAGSAGNHTLGLGLIAGAIAIGLVVLSVERLSLGAIHIFGKIPVLKRIAPKLEDLYRGMRTCLSPVPFLLTSGVSFVAWGLECLGYVYVFRAMGIDASLATATFIYAAGTVVGGLLAILPGGVGAAEGSMVGLCMAKPLSLTQPQALTSALLIRGATLWMGVLIGAGTLLGMGDLLEDDDLDDIDDATDEAVLA